MSYGFNRHADKITAVGRKYLIDISDDDAAIYRKTLRLAFDPFFLKAGLQEFTKAAQAAVGFRFFFGCFAVAL